MHFSRLVASDVTDFTRHQIFHRQAMDPRHNPNPRSTSTHTPRDVQPPHIVRASSAEPRAHLIGSNKHLGQLQVDSGIGSGSSSSKVNTIFIGSSLPATKGTSPPSIEFASSVILTPPEFPCADDATPFISPLWHFFARAILIEVIEPHSFAHLLLAQRHLHLSSGHPVPL